MARTTLPTPTPADEEAPAPAPTAPPPQTPQVTEAPAPSWSPPRPHLATIMRMMTLCFLILSISLLATNSTTIRIDNLSNTYHYNDVFAYRYALATSVIGLCYTFLHLLSSFEQMRSGKAFLNDPKIHVYVFLADKVIFALVATGVGAAFGATVDLKSAADQIEEALEVAFADIGGDTSAAAEAFAPIFSKFDDFFNRAYIPLIFLLFASLTTGISSLLSSLSLFNKNAAS